MVDDTDREVVNALLQDGRASARDIAAATGIAATTVSRRMDDLESTGVIDEYTVDIDYGALGYDVTAVFQLSVEGDGLGRVVDQLRDRREMVAVYEVTGDHDIVAVGKFTDTQSMNERIKTLLTDEDIRSASTSVVLNTVCEHEQFPVDGTDA
ncbi:AsnC family transcriptional regulator [Haloarcula quadrata]|jgi:DNA-binding Lrp family transcriptional regulator|uniref:Lrp/AsnC family transcriptional regulator n=4 Tax=Haloarcula TaxID=2237 RepID=Q5UZ96_HALMA|nr:MULTISPECIES: HTH-type transcriptional regulator Lrp [Haloarcula]AAV47407.1 transcription regulator AsnC family [Haloarcula marismortui ATCC 43049]EMA14796.1 AsnC family transcriptional regulator [Haloarcula sinaiiensis ATCC 33800]EMA16848.1 AsnC family transcriptional regulator [Haloarcula californiae ATCC 33799]NHN64798.1 Lrp/AsnC family transcriptional regulator [Haloarcula sp. JP-Z28]NHX39882.1 Lrp/AsnC family transcriptional regulator [Haloarcula sp. R1-2]